jgi:hypothetical protein
VYDGGTVEDLSHGSHNVASLGPPEEPLVEELAPAETEEIGAGSTTVAEGESLAALVPPEEAALADEEPVQSPASPSSPRPSRRRLA